MKKTIKKTQIVAKLKTSNYSNFYETQKLKLWQNSKTPIVTNLKNLIYDETQKLTLWQNSLIQIVTKLKNSNCDHTQKLNIVTKINSNCVKSQKLKLWQNLTVVIVKYFSLTHWQPVRCSQGNVLRFSRFLTVFS